MRLSIVLLTAVFLMLLAGVAGAQDEKPIRVWLDATSYADIGVDSVSYVEYCYSFQRADIQFEEAEGGYVGRPYFYLEVRDEDGDMVDSLGKSLPIGVQFLEDAYNENLRLFDCMGSTLRPGKYQLKLTVIDLNTKRTGFATRGLEVKDYNSDKLQLSDLELALRIEAAQNDSIYSSLKKAGRKVIPNPSGYFSNEDSVLCFYAEVYNLTTDPSKNDEFEIEVRMKDRYGYELKEFPVKKHKKPGSTAVISEAVSLDGLPGGDYILQVEVKDLGSGRTATSRERVSLVYTFDQLSPTMSSADSFTEDDAVMMGNVIHYISSKDEKDTYKSLDLTGKKAFLTRFWEDRNPNPGSPVNTYKNEIFRRYLYANYYFSSTLVSRSDGWKTDRGRVYITYGEPDEIERHPSSMGEKPYQRWTYDRLPGQSGGDYFVFVDEDGYGNLRLVHSTLRGEISNPDWEERLSLTPGNQ